MKDMIDHGLFGFLESTFFGTLFNQILDFILCYSISNIRVDAKEQKNQVNSSQFNSPWNFMR